MRPGCGPGTCGRLPTSTQTRSPSRWPPPTARLRLRASAWLAPCSGGARLVRPSFWQWRLGIPGVLRTAGQRRRKVTTQDRDTCPTRAPGPCRRQLVQHRYQEPKVGNTEYVQQGTAKCFAADPADRTACRSVTPRAFNGTGNTYGTPGAEAPSSMSSLLLRTLPSARGPACEGPRGEGKGRHRLPEPPGERGLASGASTWPPSSQPAPVVTDCLSAARGTCASTRGAAGRHHPK